MLNQGATAVITHHILDGKHQAYEKWLNEIGPVCQGSAGYIDWQIIRPIPNLTFSYTVIIRFDSIANLKRWMESEQRQVLIEKVNPLLAKNDHYHIQTGLDFLFVANTEKSKVPLRWKQYLATWSAIYPLSVAMPLIIIPLLRQINLSPNRFVDSLFISGFIVFVMVYLLMPAYTKLIKNWLYK